MSKNTVEKHEILSRETMLFYRDALYSSRSTQSMDAKGKGLRVVSAKQLQIVKETLFLLLGTSPG